MTCPKDSTGDIVRIPREGRRVLGELLSKKLLRDKRGDVSLSGSQHFAAGAPRGEHGNTTLPSASSRRVSLPFTQFPAHLGGPFDINSALRRTLVKESRLQLGGSSQDFFSRSLPPPLEAPSTRNPRPRRRVAPPSPRPRSFHAGQERCRFPISQRFFPLTGLLAVFFTPLLWRVSSGPS